MNDVLIPWLIIIGFWALGFGFGYITGNANPPKGEIILTTFGPHKCKGVPGRSGWYEGTQWRCSSCQDIWELQGTYDGIETGSEWKRITVKGKKKK